MSRRALGSFPPDALPPFPERHLAWLHRAWLALVALALAVQACGLASMGYAFTRTAPSFTAFGLAASVYDDEVRVDPLTRDVTAAGVTDGARIVAIEGAPISTYATARLVAARLRAVTGGTLHLRLRDDQGAMRDVTLERAAPEAVRRQHERSFMRVAGLVVLSLVQSAVLCASATLLYRRRGDEPVALLLSVAFLLMTITTNLSIAMWRDLHLMKIPDLVSAVWWMLVMIGLAAFPDGRFEPRWQRWILVVSPICAAILQSEQISGLLTLVLGFGPLLAILGGQLVNYRRLPPGDERQQLKWAAFGFLVGILALGVVAILGDIRDGGHLSPATAAWLTLAVLALFTVAFLAMPLGLLVSLLRYRLWEADRVISRSLAYFAVTALVGILWAATSDIVKDLVGSLLGADNKGYATGASALLAVAVFAPTQKLATRWTERRFGRRTGEFSTLPARLELWRDTEIPGELGMRALAVIASGVRAESAALLALTPTGRELVAARDLAAPEALTRPGPLDAAARGFPIELPLTDVDGEVGTLLLGRRRDGNRYSPDERAAVADLAEPLAAALRAARHRAEREEGMARHIAAVEARLAKLEGPGGAMPI